MKFILMSTQYVEEKVVSWEDVAFELENNFEMDNADFITLRLEGETAFIQSTELSDNVFSVEVGNGLVGKEQTLVSIEVETKEEVVQYLKDFCNTCKFPDTSNWNNIARN